MSANLVDKQFWAWERREGRQTLSAWVPRRPEDIHRRGLIEQGGGAEQATAFVVVALLVLLRVGAGADAYLLSCIGSRAA